MTTLNGLTLIVLLAKGWTITLAFVYGNVNKFVCVPDILETANVFVLAKVPKLDNTDGFCNWKLLTKDNGDKWFFLTLMFIA